MTIYALIQIVKNVHRQLLLIVIVLEPPLGVSTSRLQQALSSAW
jgi:hypothetical protein